MTCALWLLLACTPDAASAPQVKLLVRETGLHRVTGADFAAAGLSLADLPASRLALTCQGEGVPCRVLGTPDDRLADSSEIVFYGEALDTRYTDTNVYWLSWEGEPGPRMGALELGAGAADPLPSFSATVRFEQNQLFAMLYSEFLPPDGSLNPWFWTAARPGKPAEVALQLPGLSPEVGEVGIRVLLRGRTSSLEHDPDHHARVAVGETVVGEATFDGQAEALIEGQASADAFRGEAKLRVEVVGDSPAGDRDQVYLDWVECTYARVFSAVEGRLDFRLATGDPRTVTVKGLADGTAEVYEVSDPLNPRFAAVGPVEGGRAAFTLAGAGSYVATTAAAYLKPFRVQLAQPPSLRQADEGADLVIVAYDEFVEPLAPLVEYRKAQGLRVRVVPVSAIYDEFSGGVFTPVAIQDFLAYAYREWPAPAPAFVLLVGDASYDFRDYLGTGAPCFVPTYEVPTAGSIPTATDHWFACVGGDDHVPDLAIGRFPVRSPEEVRAVVAKTIAYETAAEGDWQKRALLVADHDGADTEPGRYETICRGLQQSMGQSGLTAELAALREVDPALPSNERADLIRAQFTPQVLRAFGEGTALIEFQGHGNEQFWSRQKVLALSDVANLEPNPALPICIDISCFTGWFDKPDLPGGHCLAEALILAPGAGAVACIAPSRLGGLNLDAQLIPALLSSQDRPLGEVLRNARRSFVTAQASAAWDAVENYNLLGDPTLRVRLAAKPMVAEVTPPAPQPSVPATPLPVEEADEQPETEMAFALGRRPVDSTRPAGIVLLPSGRLNIQQAEPYVPGSLKRLADRSLLFVAKLILPGKPREGPNEAPGNSPSGPPALTEADWAPLAALGGRVVRQVPHSAVIVSLTPAQADQAAALPVVAWLGRLAPRLKIEPALMAKALVFYGTSTVLVEHVGPDCVEGLLTDVKQEGGGSVDSPQPLPPNALLIEGPSGLIAALANDERVVAVTRPPSEEPPLEKEPER
jgi:hypothetical protein